MKFIPALILLLTLFSCKNEPQDKLEMEAIASLESEIEQLKFENVQKDSMINSALRFYKEIEANLQNIGVRQGALKASVEDPESTFRDKEWMIQEIQQINFLRVQNQKSIKQLKAQLEKSGVEISELQELIRGLVEDVEVKEEQLLVLREELDRSNQELARLFDAFQEKEFELQTVEEEMNKVFYVYGTESELVENGVLDKKNGFLGIGKKVEIKKNTNLKYFTEKDLRDFNDLTIMGEDARIITPHDTDAYSMETDSKKAKLKIVNPRSFWKLSKILVVVVK